MDIFRVESEEQIDRIRELFREYESFLDEDLGFQQFGAELENLPGEYGPPDGILLLAMEEDISIGCGALRRFGPARDRTCEMKRLYVRPEARGKGVGKRIAEALIEEAIRMGYSTMVLDTLERLIPAISLYRSLGFVRTGAYYHNPLQEVLYWKLDLECWQ